VHILDEGVATGSHYFRSPFADPKEPGTNSQLAGLIRRLGRSNITVQKGTAVWGIEGKRLFTHSEAGCASIEFDQLIVATGAREYTYPFPGWELPGVMGLGGFQMLLKSKAIRTVDSVVIAGSSPLLLKVAYEAVSHGIKPKAVNLTGSTGSHLPVWLQLGFFPSKVSEAWKYLRGLVNAGVPFRFNRPVIEAFGDSHLCEIKMATSYGTRSTSMAESEAKQLDVLAIGDGFVPNIELTEMLGCDHHFEPELGGWAVKVDKTLQTSVKDVYSAGETVGIAGAACAFIEGEIAGLTVAHKLDRISSATYQTQVQKLKGGRTRERRFGRIISQLRRTSQMDLFGLDPGVIFCRCEGVTLGEIRRAIEAGVRDIDELKNWLRVGQGYCQGRTCGPLLVEMLTKEIGCSPEKLGRFRPRPPILPLQLGGLAGGSFEI
jgi:NAD(P)H-nitrite reductase large subunit